MNRLLESGCRRPLFCPAGREKKPAAEGHSPRPYMNRGPERARKFTIIVFCLTEYGYPIGQRELFMIKGHKTSWAVGRRENQLPRRRMKFSRMWAVPVRALKFQAAPWSAAHGPFAMRLHRKTKRKREECTHAQKDDPEESCIRHGAAAVLRGVPAGRTALYPPTAPGRRPRPRWRGTPVPTGACRGRTAHWGVRLTFWLEEVVARGTGRRARCTPTATWHAVMCCLPWEGSSGGLTPLRIQGYLYEKMNQGLSPTRSSSTM